MKKTIASLLLLFLTASQAWAFSCATGANVGSRLTISVLNSATPCAAGQWAIFSPAEFTAYQQAVADIAAVSAVVAASPANQPFDLVLATSFWSFALTFVLGSWLLANNIGMILTAIKRW